MFTILRFFWGGLGGESTPLVYGTPHMVKGTIYIPGGMAGAVFTPGFAKATVQQGDH